MMNAVVKKNGGPAARESGRNKIFPMPESGRMKLGGQVWRPAPLKVEFSKILIPMPLLFLSGVFAGIGIMLAVN
jgi:hypothetical protein